MATIHTNCLIIGSGPAGYTAAIYASRANLNPIVIEGVLPGGQLTTTTEIENFPGYPEGITGSEMMYELRQQAERFGAVVNEGIIEKIDFSARPFIAVDDSGNEYEAKTVIIATGASAKYLGINDEKTYAGRQRFGDFCGNGILHALSVFLIKGFNVQKNRRFFHMAIRYILPSLWLYARISLHLVLGSRRKLWQRK